MAYVYLRGKSIRFPLSVLMDINYFAQPVSLVLGLYTGFSFAMIFSFFGSYTYVYSTVYQFDARQIGLCYIGLIIGKSTRHVIFL